MIWVRETPPTLRVTLEVCTSEGSPYQAVTVFEYTVWCPACRAHQLLEQTGYPGVDRNRWSTQSRRFYWELPSMSDYWYSLMRNLGQHVCKACGTMGILPQSNVSALHDYMAAHYTDEKFQAALGDLGFQVDRENNNYIFVGVRSDQTHVFVGH